MRCLILLLILSFVVQGCSSKRNYVLTFECCFDYDTVSVISNHKKIMSDEVMLTDLSTGLSDMLKIKTKRDSIMIVINDLPYVIPLQKNKEFVFIRYIHSTKSSPFFKVEYDSIAGEYW